MRRIWNIFEELDYAGLERIFRPDNKESSLRNHPLEQIGSVPQVIHLGPHVGTNCFAQEAVLILVAPSI